MENKAQWHWHTPKKSTLGKWDPNKNKVTTNEKTGWTKLNE